MSSWSVPEGHGLDTSVHVKISNLTKRSRNMASVEAPVPCGEGEGGMAQLPLTLAQMVMLNAIVCGLEFCASAAFTYIPPMLLKAGIEEKHMSMVLGCGPLLGFIIVPMIGRASDRCQSRFGRRRPFIFWMSLLLISSLIIIPYGQSLSSGLPGAGPDLLPAWHHVGIFMLVVGSVLLDFTSQATLTPCEALLSDASKPTNQQDRIFIVYSFMVSIGGCVGYLLAALEWKSTAMGLFFGSQERCVFSVLVVLFTVTMLMSLCIAEEKPVQLVDSNHVNRQLDQIHKAMVREKQLDQIITGQDAGYETSSNQSTSDELTNLNSLNNIPVHNSNSLVNMNHPDMVPLMPHSKSLNDIQDLDSKPQRFHRIRKLFRERHLHLPCGIISAARWDAVCQALWITIQRFLPDTIRSMLKVPFVLRRLAVTNFFAWSAVMGFNLFYTDFVGQAVYHGNPNAEEGSELRDLYDEGVRMGSWGLLFHCCTSAVYAGFVERLVGRYGPRTTYFIGMLSFTLCMFFMVLSRGIFLVNLMAACTGFAYATVTTIPFTLVTLYHDNKEVYFYDVMPSSGTTHTRGIGSDMATLDSAYFFSQIVISAVMGYIVSVTGSVVAYMVVAGALGAVASACVARIIFNKQQMAAFIRGNNLISNQMEL